MSRKVSGKVVHVVGRPRLLADSDPAADMEALLNSTLRQVCGYVSGGNTAVFIYSLSEVHLLINVPFFDNFFLL